MVLEVTGPVANRYAELLVEIRGKYFSPARWLVVLGLTGRVANRYAVLLVAIWAKNVSPLHWLLVLGLTGRVVNRVGVVAGLRFGRKRFWPYTGLRTWRSCDKVQSSCW